MPIQFSCTSCSEPIEVDDEHAGQTAACPYCRHVVTVPQESTYHPDAAIQARPTTPDASRGGDHADDEEKRAASWGAGADLETAQVSARRRAAATFGNFGLICTVLACVLFGIATVRAMYVVLGSAAATQPGPLSLADMPEAQQALAGDPWYMGPIMGALFFAVVGLVLSIVSVVQEKRGNWRGFIGIVVCGLFLLCTCGSALFGMLRGFGMPAAG